MKIKIVYVVLLLISFTFLIVVSNIKSVSISINNKVSNSSDQSNLTYQLVINEVIPNNYSLADKHGIYYDLIEIYNPTSSTINITGLGLSDDPALPHKWTFKDGIIEPGEYLIVYAANSNLENTSLEGGYYTNFKLNSKGERVILSDKDGISISKVNYESLEPNMSIGLVENEYRYFESCTPGKKNIGIIITDLNEYKKNIKIIPSIPSGIYSKPIEVSLNAQDDYDLYYTLDGTNPSTESILYKQPIYIDYTNKNPIRIANNRSTFGFQKVIKSEDLNKGTVIKARYFNGNMPMGDIFVATYFVWNKGTDRYTFDIVSLTTEPDNLFDPTTGIYVVGDRFSENLIIHPNGESPANYNQRGREWERDAYIELFNQEGERVLNQDIGIRIFGGWSRSYPKKSFKLFARSEYGKGTFKFPFFKDLVDNNGDIIDSFQKLILRNSGDDYEFTLFRDALTGRLVNGIVDFQHYKPVILFLNGEYWGIYNLRENLDKNYIASHYNLDPENVNIIIYSEAGLESYQGEEEELDRYKAFLAYVEDNDLVDNKNYEYVKQHLDIDNFINYYITQIYIDNTDWPVNNSKVWRYSGEGLSDGKYRFMLFDTDFGFGLNEGVIAAAHNSFKFLQEDTNSTWPNPNWSTNLYKNLMKNEEFKKQFIKRFADMMNTTFSEKNVLDKINEFQSLYEPEIREYGSRWEFDSLLDLDMWDKENVDILREFSLKRNDYLYDFAKEQYNLGELVPLKIKSFENGSLCVNNFYQIDSQSGLTVKYFSDTKVTLTLTVNEGYEFVKWDIESVEPEKSKKTLESVDLTNPNIELTITSPINLIPIIVKLN